MVRRWTGVWYNFGILNNNICVNVRKRVYTIVWWAYTLVHMHSFPKERERESVSEEEREKVYAQTRESIWKMMTSHGHHGYRPGSCSLTHITLLYSPNAPELLNKNPRDHHSILSPSLSDSLSLSLCLFSAGNVLKVLYIN